MASGSKTKRGNGQFIRGFCPKQHSRLNGAPIGEDMSKKLLEQIDAACAPTPETATARFAATLDTAANSNGQKRIPWPSEILTPFTDNRVRGGHFTPLGQKTLAAILSDVDLWPPEILDQLNKLQSEYAALKEKQAAFTLKAANEFHATQRQRLTSAAHAGEMPQQDEAAIRSRESIQEDFRHKYSAIGEVMSRVYRQAVELMLPVWNKAEQAVSDSMQVVETAEREQAARFDLPWLPSAIYRAHASAALFVSKRISAFKRFLNNVPGYGASEPLWTVANLTTN